MKHEIKLNSINLNSSEEKQEIEWNEKFIDEKRFECQVTIICRCWNMKLRKFDWVENDKKISSSH